MFVAIFKQLYAMASTMRFALKICISAITIFYGFVPAFADLNETHVLNPLWSAHARFHGIWFLAFAAGIALIGLCLIWRHNALYVPIFFGLMFAVGFWVATIFGPTYGAALFDANGHVQTIAGIEANMFLFSTMTVILIAALGLTAWVSRAKS